MPGLQFIVHDRCRRCVRHPTFHHRRGVCIGTALPPPGALIVIVEFDTAHAVVTVATTTNTAMVMILRISSSILGSMPHFHSDCEIDYSVPIHAACDGGHSV
jgi:hypothetical protein